MLRPVHDLSVAERCGITTDRNGLNGIVLEKSARFWKLKTEHLPLVEDAFGGDVSVRCFQAHVYEMRPGVKRFPQKTIPVCTLVAETGNSPIRLPFHEKSP